MRLLIALMSTLVLVEDAYCHQHLYTHPDLIVNLKESNIKDTLQGKDHAWALEFYNNFATNWISLAKELQAWGPVLKLAAINCAREENVGTCNDFNITEVPEVRLFTPHSPEHSIGYHVDHNDKRKLLKEMVKFVEKVQRDHSPQSWPDLQNFNGSLEDLVSDSDVPMQALVLDSSSDSLVGRLVVLDLSKWQDKVQVVRAVKSPEDMSLSVELQPPALVVLNNGSRDFYTAAHGFWTRQAFSSKLCQLLGITLQMPSTSISQVMDPNAANSTCSSTTAPKELAAGAYLVDLENAVVHALTQEVVLQLTVGGEAMDALKGFIVVLANLFSPKADYLFDPLSNVYSWLSNRTQVSGANLYNVVTKTTLPPPRAYVGCLGTCSAYRGYPCSMWTLFHTLSVAAVPYENNFILPYLHNYIKHFFCSDWSEHFQQMAMEDGLFNVTDPREAVLWLWRAHNRVNKRLAGDTTEDPHHPKQQFPPQELCPWCRDDDGNFNEAMVLPFLMRFYGEEEMLLEGLNEAVLVAAV